jgi:hypothetical protein
MKKTIKILGILAAALLVGGMIIACTHAEGGLSGAQPDYNPNTETGSGGSIPTAAKAEILALYDEAPSDFSMMGSYYGLSHLPSNPHTWTDAHWAEAWAKISVDFEEF